MTKNTVEPAAAGAAAGVVGLQRSIGNRATTAVLALQRACMLDTPPPPAPAGHAPAEPETAPSASTPPPTTLLEQAGLQGGGGGGGAGGGATATKSEGALADLAPGATAGPTKGGGPGGGGGALFGAGATTGGLARPMVRPGSKGLDVSHLQTLINALGATPALSTDGQFGPATAKAVRAFQSARGLVADAVVGPRTWAELDVGRDAAPDLNAPPTPAGPTTAPAGPAGPEPEPEPQTLRDRLIAAMRAGKSIAEISALMDTGSWQEAAALLGDPVFLAEYAKYQDTQLRKALFERLLVQYWAYTSSAEALTAARAQVGSMFDAMSNASLQQTILSSKIQIHIIPRDKNLTDLPPFAGLTTTFDGRSWKDVRGIQKREGNISYVGMAEESLIGGNRITTDPDTGEKTETPSGYGAGFMASHETGHAIKESSLTPSQSKALEAAYAKHLADHPLTGQQETHAKWLPPAWYAASNSHEYFAQGVAAWRGTPRSDSEASDFTRANLASIDPGLYDVLRTVFRE